MRFRITVRGDGVELRGYVERDSLNQVERLFADDLQEDATLIVSRADDDYNPFLDEALRELHHFETEEIIDKPISDEEVREAVRAHKAPRLHVNDSGIDREIDMRAALEAFLALRKGTKP